MKKLLFAFCILATSTAFADDPTPTATATTTSTPTATATATPSATATGTPVPTPTPMAVLYRQDTQGQGKALEAKQTDADRVTLTNNGPAVDVSGPQDVATASDPEFNSVLADNYYLNDGGQISAVGSGAEFFLGNLLGVFPTLGVLSVKNGDYPTFVDTGGGSSRINTSHLTAPRTHYPPDKDGEYVVSSDLPNMIGEAHFDPADVGSASLFGNISSVSVLGAGKYQIAFATELADANYGVTIGVSTTSSHGAPDDWESASDSEANTTELCVVKIKLFNPGILGVALPSYDYTDPVGKVTVVIYKNP